MIHPKQIKNRLRILELSYKAGVAHLGSALSAIDIIEAIYQVKKPKEKFVLSAGHAASALYVVLESYGYLDRPDIKKLSIHPVRKPSKGIDVSSGSIGHGLPIAVGMALSDRKKNVYCCISDGECDEGSISEALRVGNENNLTNLIIVVNVNGYSAYRETNLSQLKQEFKAFGWKVICVNGHDLNDLKKALVCKQTKPKIIVAKTRVDQLPFLHGLDAHYHKMSKENYQLARKIWSKN